MSETAAIVFNPLEPAFRADPYPFYARLRSEDPVHEAPFGRWVVSRYDDCVALLKDPRASNDPAHAEASIEFVRKFGLNEELAKARPFLLLDPPEHGRMRRLVGKAFTPKVVEGMRPRTEQLVDHLLDAAATKGSLELIDDLAYPLPVTVVCEMLGVPAEDHVTFQQWSRKLARGQDPWEVIPPDVVRGFLQAMTSFMEYFRDLIAEHRKRPREDVLSALIAAEDAGDTLTETELLATCVFLLSAGHETTVNLIGNGIFALLRHPEQLERLRNDSSLMPGAVEELLRHDSPVQFALRIAREDIEIRGKTIPKGKQILVALGSANRDPEQFSDPDQLDITRENKHHIAFGYGSHFCLGAPLARLEAEIAFRALLRRFPGLELAPEPPQYKENIVLRGLQRLPLAYSRSSSRNTP